MQDQTINSPYNFEFFLYQLQVVNILKLLPKEKWHPVLTVLRQTSCVQDKITLSKWRDSRTWNIKVWTRDSRNVLFVFQCILSLSRGNGVEACPVALCRLLNVKNSLYRSLASILFGCFCCALNFPFIFWVIQFS